MESNGMKRGSKKLSRSSKSSKKSIPKEIFSEPSDKWTFSETLDDEDRSSLMLSRTSLLLLDYRMFKAARTIQRFFRGWYVRRVRANQTAAALKIQREWRRFYAARFVYDKLENLLQERTWAHYHRAATMIQALWRGFWVREHIHDQYRLAKMQQHAAEDLLQCVAFKLHHMLRTHQIPGVYSLRNSHCLSKVERLLSSMHYKLHNERMRVLRNRREARENSEKKSFEKCVFLTDIPYAGPDFKGVCIPRCTELYNEKDADIKMHRILSSYQNAMGRDRRVDHIKKHPKGEVHKTKNVKKKKKKKQGPDFCTDVVNSMKRWKILTDNNLSVNPNIFKRPENLEQFLNEIQSVYSMMQERCHCYTHPVDAIECGVK